MFLFLMTCKANRTFFDATLLLVLKSKDVACDQLHLFFWMIGCVGDAGWSHRESVRVYPDELISDLRKTNMYISVDTLMIKSQR